MNAPVFCTQCGSPRTPGVAFCTMCGAAHAPTSTPVGPAAQPPPPAMAAAPGLSAMSTGMGLAAKLGLAALVVGAAGGGTWLAVDSQNNRANPAAQTAQSAPGNPAAQPAQGATGTPTMPIEPPEFTVSGPSAVPYGELAVVAVTLNNTTALPVRVAGLHQTTDLRCPTSETPFCPISWSPDYGEGGSLERVEPGASFTWTVTIGTRFMVMDQYTLYFELDAYYLDGPDSGDFEEDAGLMFTVASPVRPLESHWNDYCQLKKAYYAAGQVEVTRRECEYGYDEADPTCWEDSEREYWEARNEALLSIQEIEDELFSFVDEREDFEQYPCDCWCRANPEYVCDNIPWGTTADLPSYTPEPSEQYVPPIP